MQRAPADVGDGYDLVVLSPHLDDAALSAGGMIAAAGGRALVVTLCTADPPARPSRFAEELHRQQGGARVAERRAEDRAAMALLGCDFAWGGLADAIYRGVTSMEALFAAPASGDELPALALLRRLGVGSALVLAPLAAGGHVDHRLTRAAAEVAGFARLAYYEDFPYVAQRPGALAAAAAGLAAEVVGVTATLSARAAAIAAYASQHAMLTGGVGATLALLHGYVAEVGGERLWR